MMALSALAGVSYRAQLHSADPLEGLVEAAIANRVLERRNERVEAERRNLAIEFANEIVSRFK